MGAASDHGYIANGGILDWFSKRKVRLPVGSGLYIGIFQNSSNTGVGTPTASHTGIGLTMYGQTTVYKKFA